MNKPTQQQVVEAYKRLPPPVQEFLADPDKLARVLASIRDTHNLHIDVAGQIGESIGYLLLGLASPSEFKEMLKTANVSESTAGDIISEINQKIFVPLREEMRKGPAPRPAVASGGGGLQAPAKPAAPTPPLLRQGYAGHSEATEGTAREAVLQPRTTMIPANPQFAPRPAEAYGVGGPRPAQTLAQVPRYVPPKKYFNLQNKIPPASPKATQGTAPPATPKPMESNKLLEDHEESHIEFKKTPMPARSAPPPPNLPGAIQPPPPLPKPEPVVPSVPVEPYSSDPYREPIV